MVPKGYKFPNRKRPPKFTPEHIQHLRDNSAMKNPKNVKRQLETKHQKYPFGYTGHESKYAGIHKWLREKYGRPSSCEHCYKKGRIRSSDGRWNIDYAKKNSAKTYTKRLSDYLKLCRSCHMKYDGITINKSNESPKN